MARDDEAAHGSDKAAKTVRLYSDIGCPWAHVAVHRLRRARARAGVDGLLLIDHRPFALELVNERPTPQRVLAGEIPIVAGLEPDAGWAVWSASPYEWPVTTLPAMEAVQAAKAQGLAAAEELDRALRLAFFRDGRCVTMRHVVVDVATATPGVDADAIADALDRGSARRALMEGFAEARAVAKGSPHLFLPDGVDVANPGITMQPAGDGSDFPRVERDDPSVYDELIRVAMGASRVA
ncbi:MAG TPA: DsbA family protein [Acidimicrobiia bacterium]|jgi:predicted DsbA family dithiol-disulfide isomerase